MSKLTDMKDRFVANFVIGMAEGRPLVQESIRILKPEESWPRLVWGKDIQWKGGDCLNEIADEAIRKDDDEEKTDVVPVRDMPGFFGPSGTVICTGGTINPSALSQGFAIMEQAGAIVSAVVADAFAVSDMRMFLTHFVSGISEERGVFGTIWGAEVYMRNFHIPNSSSTDHRDRDVWIISLPTTLYEHGLCSKVSIVVGL